jgi:signal transduction histidine kinase
MSDSRNDHPDKQRPGLSRVSGLVARHRSSVPVSGMAGSSIDEAVPTDRNAARGVRTSRAKPVDKQSATVRAGDKPPAQAVARRAPQSRGEPPPSRGLGHPAQSAQPVQPATAFDLLSRMGHELRSPLSAILGFAQILREAGEGALPQTVQRQMLQQLEASAMVLSGTINDLVQYARHESGRETIAAASLDLGALLAQIVKQVSPVADSAKVTLDCSATGLPLHVQADPVALTHLLLNLTLHAIRYNRRGGTVNLEIARDPDADCVCVRVRDPEGAVSPEQLQMFLDPFSKTTLDGSSRNGAGIGLVVARQLAQSLGIRLDLQGNPQQGSVFAIWLPLVPQESPSMRAHGLEALRL